MKNVKTRDLELKKAVLNNVEEQVQIFTSKMCQMVEWIEDLKSYHYSNFARSYLMPRRMMNVPRNTVAFVYAFAAMVLGRKLKKSVKEMRYNANQDFIDDFLFIVSLLDGAIRNKKEIFKSLQNNGAISTQQDFNMLVFAYLVNTYASLKAGEDDTNERFKIFKSMLPFYLEDWKLEIKEGLSLPRNTIQITLKGVVKSGKSKNDGKSKSELQEQKGVICRTV